MPIDIDHASQTASSCVSSIRASLLSNNWSIPQSTKSAEVFIETQASAFGTMYNAFLHYLANGDELLFGTRCEALKAATQSVCGLLNLSKDIPATTTEEHNQKIIARGRDFQKAHNILALAQQLEYAIQQGMEDVLDAPLQGQLFKP